MFREHFTVPVCKKPRIFYLIFSPRYDDFIGYASAYYNLPAVPLKSNKANKSWIWKKYAKGTQKTHKRCDWQRKNTHTHTKLQKKKKNDEWRYIAKQNVNTSTINTYPTPLPPKKYIYTLNIP